MAINKIVYGVTTLVDLTDATASADDILNGESAYGADGQKLNGTLVVQRYYTGSSEPPSSLGNNGDLYLKVVS